MESYISISNLNDFIFCPRSIYFHNLYYNYDDSKYQQTSQLNGKIAHKCIDEKTYSTRKSVLQNIDVFCEKYGLCGKIDIFDIDTGKLSERKREIKIIYNGYIFQVYAQYFSLIEMGYNVKSIVLYDITHNKIYNIKLPHEDAYMLNEFEILINKIKRYDITKDNTTPNINKCLKCIYSNLCDFNIC